MMGFSMFNPFWTKTMEVYPGVTAGAIILATVGGMSGMFLVHTIINSNGAKSVSLTFGTFLETKQLLVIDHEAAIPYCVLDSILLLEGLHDGISP